MLNRYKTLYHFTCQPQKSKTVSVIFAQQPWSCMAKTVCFHLHTVVPKAGLEPARISTVDFESTARNWLRNGLFLQHIKTK